VNPNTGGLDTAHSSCNLHTKLKFANTSTNEGKGRLTTGHIMVRPLFITLKIGGWKAHLTPDYV